MNYNEILNNGSNYLKKYNFKNSLLESELLLSKVLNKKREDLILNSKNILKIKEIKKFNEFLLRRKRYEPIAYILGFKYFWKFKFITDKSVLIPRPDTELIVEESLKHIPKNISKKILDIGTGSGCIAISILKERSKCVVTGLDLSIKAINVYKSKFSL